jgi:hypothetical protein
LFFSFVFLCYIKDFGRRTHFVTDATHTETISSFLGGREKNKEGVKIQKYINRQRRHFGSIVVGLFYNPTQKKLPKFRKTFKKKRKCRDEEVPSGLWPTRGSFFCKSFSK